MFFHIMKREILDHLMSLRFALSLVAVTSLLVLGTFIFVSSDHKQKLAEYSSKQRLGQQPNKGELSAAK